MLTPQSPKNASPPRPILDNKRVPKQRRHTQEQRDGGEEVRGLLDVGGDAGEFFGEDLDGDGGGGGEHVAL